MLINPYILAVTIRPCCQPGSQIAKDQRLACSGGSQEIRPPDPHSAGCWPKLSPHLICFFYTTTTEDLEEHNKQIKKMI